jgi:hypothetical protein
MAYGIPLQSSETVRCMRLTSGMKRASVLLMANLAVALAAQPPARQNYVISTGTAANTISSGTIWLYSYSWYGLQKIELAAIKDGFALVPTDTERLKRELDPHPNTDGYVLAVQVGEHLWYRTPDISPDVIWNKFLPSLNSLGQATLQPTGETRLILPAPRKRHITLLYPDARPVTEANITISIYLWNRNHCGFHEGLPLGTFRTDRTGTLEVIAPRVPLYLGGVYYYEAAGTGPAGVAYSSNAGLKTGVEDNLVLKKKWNLTDDDSLAEAAELRVVAANGKPRRDVNVNLYWATNTCGGAARVGQTDDKGVVQLQIDPTVIGLELMIGGPYSADAPEARSKSYQLGDGELRQLFTRHQLTIRW